VAECVGGAAAVEGVGCGLLRVAGHPSDAALELVEVTRQSLQAAIDVCGPGVPVRAIGSAISDVADKAGTIHQHKHLGQLTLVQVLATTGSLLLSKVTIPNYIGANL
jgi:methionine aminopeptidase